VNSFGELERIVVFLSSSFGSTQFDSMSRPNNDGLRTPLHIRIVPELHSRPQNNPRHLSMNPTIYEKMTQNPPDHRVAPPEFRYSHNIQSLDTMRDVDQETVRRDVST
jgi:hypothetical protein